MQKQSVRKFWKAYK